jgi:uncharacterized protein GlcG (DUF336 family)
MSNMVMSLDLAQKYITKTIEIASTMHLRVAVAVVDRGGRPVATARMDHVGYIAQEVAIKKANAAQSLGASLQDILENVSSDISIMQAFSAMDSEIIVLPGGFPITDVTSIIGGLGISGGHYRQDHEIGQKVVSDLARFF